MTGISKEEIEIQIKQLGNWFQNMELGGVQTAPNHFLGDYPAIKWRHFQHAIPSDLSGKTILDIGCNAGFYALEMKRRGAVRVVGIDADPDYLAQARFAAKIRNLDVEFLELSVYEVAQLGEQFDIVIFMGVLYHLRHPLLALDLIHQHVARDMMIFQSMQRGSREVASVPKNSAFQDTDVFETAGYPLMYFVEECYSDDPTNWWIPNMACSLAMLRSAGFQVVEHPEQEVYICKRVRLHG